MNVFSSELTDRDLQTIDECLCAAEREEFFPEWEPETLFGISRKQLSAVREKWPEVDHKDPNVGAAVLGALNHLLRYPHAQDAYWNEYISVMPAEHKLTLNKLLSFDM